jgi:hypothetical protein
MMLHRFHLRLCILNGSKCNLSSCLARRAIFRHCSRAKQNLIMWLTKLKRSRMTYGWKFSSIFTCSRNLSNGFVFFSSLLSIIAFLVRKGFTVFALTLIVTGFKWPKVFYMTISIHPLNGNTFSNRTNKLLDVKSTQLHVQTPNDTEVEGKAIETCWKFTRSEIHLTLNCHFFFIAKAKFRSNIDWEVDSGGFLWSSW